MAPRLHPNNSFLAAILSTWARLHNKEPVDEIEVLSEMLWDNRHILIKQRPFIWPSWKDAGILYLNDLLHDSLPRFMSHEELGDKYRITVSFLELLQLRSAIPTLWKRKIIHPATGELEVKPSISTVEGRPIGINAKSSKVIYHTLVQFLKPSLSSQQKWNDVFPVDPIDDQEYWSLLPTRLPGIRSFRHFTLGLSTNLFPATDF